MLQSTGNALVRALLAPACVACQRVLARPLEGPVCPDCWQGIPRLKAPLCSWCGDSLPTSHAPFEICSRCLTSPPGFERARSAGLYAGSLRTLIHAFKYGRRRMLAAPLGALLLANGGDVLEGANAVVPVPLHPWRSLQRGFNQADDLAQYLRLPVWRLLRRIRHGPSQASLPARQRQANVEAAFARSWLPTLVPGSLANGRLRNSSVVLIDDVMTTGATLDACSRVLLEAGARSVRALTVARAAAPGREPLPAPLRPSSLPR
jgi:ComF family protein